MISRNLIGWACRFSVTLVTCTVAAGAWAHGHGKNPQVIGPRALLQHEAPYAGHGVAGDRALLFNIEIQPPDISGPPGTRVGVYSRITKEKVGELPPYENPAWAIPMNIVLEEFVGAKDFSMGTVLVLEVGLVPNQAPAFLRLIRYGYLYSHRYGFFTRVVDFGDVPVISSLPGELPNGIGLPVAMDIVAAADGTRHVVLADSFGGSIWSTPQTNLSQWQMDLFAEELLPTPNMMVCDYNGEPIIGFCGYARGPDWSIERYVQKMWQPVPGLDLLPGSFGLAFIGKTGMVAVNNAGVGAIYEVDATLLLDRNLPPFTMAKPLSMLVEPVPGVTDLQGSLAWDRWHPNTEWIYWHRILSDYEGGHWPIYRANIHTGEVQYVAESIYLFDHPSMMAAIPSHFGQPQTVLVSSNVQERNGVLTNMLLSESRLVGPSVVTETRIRIPFDEW
jgi:hypothetical protein